MFFQENYNCLHIVFWILHKTKTMVCAVNQKNFFGAAACRKTVYRHFAWYKAILFAVDHKDRYTAVS